MEESSTKRQRILDYLKKNPRGLTGMDMVQLFGSLNYKNDIFVLRGKGVPIADEWERKYDEKGREIMRWKRYYIPADARRGND